jgi:uncharacterized membrane protein
LILKILIILGILMICVGTVLMFFSDEFSRRKIFSGKLVLALGFVILGQAMCFLGILSIYNNLRVKNWAQIRATVVESSIIEKRVDQAIYVPRVIYQYEYQGHTYQSDRIKFEDFYNSDKNWIETKLYHKFFVGNTIDVWVNPKNPAEAVVDPVGDNEYDFVVILFGTFLSAIGAYLVLGVRKQREQD